MLVNVMTLTVLISFQHDDHDMPSSKAYFFGVFGRAVGFFNKMWNEYNTEMLFWVDIAEDKNMQEVQLWPFCIWTGQNRVQIVGIY